MLDFGRMRILVAVAETGSMTGAAAVLGRTQPAISRQIAALERQAGLRLLVRTPTGVRLTPAGELLVAHARAITDRLNLAQRQMTRLASVPALPLRIGSFSSANSALIPAAIREYVRRRPEQPTPLLPATDTHQHLTQLRTGRLDLALVTEWDLHGADLDGIRLVPLTEDEMLLALPHGHPLTRRRIRLTDLRDEPWIDGAHPDCLGPLGGLRGVLGCAPTIDIRCDDFTGKQGLVAAGAGVMFFPALARRSVRTDVVLHRLDDQIPRRRIYLAAAAAMVPSAPVDAMIEVLRTTARAHSVTGG